MSSFEQFFGADPAQKQKDAEMRTRILKLEGQVGQLQTESVKHRSALVKANGLLKECILRLELIKQNKGEG